MSKIAILAIDVQRDFCDENGALSVKGAKEDSIRLSKLIDVKGNDISQIFITLDSHNEFDIAHPVFWVNEQGENPSPFTIITKNDVKNETWRSANEKYQSHALEYVKALESNGKYPLCIWPSHCIMGSEGWCIEENILNSINRWSKEIRKNIKFYIKGLNPLTEHYSAFKADVEMNSDPSTLMNEKFIYDMINSLQMNQCDEILIAGQAKSHCVANSLYDFSNFINYAYNKHSSSLLSKVVLLEDAMSSVTGFENLGDKFFEDMISLGMKIAKTTDYI
jgi:nicotinamidase/pyrazinamidase